MRRLILILLVVVSMLFMIPDASAQLIGLPSLEVANLYFPGHPAFLVGIQIDGTCQAFVDVGASHFLYLTTGNYDVTLSDDTGVVDSCTGPVLFQSTLSYTEGEFYTIFIYPDQSNAVGVSFFQNDVSPIPTGTSRLLVRNGVGDRATISLSFREASMPRPYTTNVANGAQSVLELPAGDWEIGLLNPPSALIASQALRQNLPYSDGELWLVEVGGPIVQGGLGIFDYRYYPPNN